MKNKQMIVALLAGSLSLATNVKAGDPPDAVPAPPPPGQAQPPAQPGAPGQNTQEHRRADAAPDHSCLGATDVIGRPVRNDVGEHLGTVHDLIVNLEQDTARFAIIRCGGTLGIGATRVAIPLKDLKWSGEEKLFTVGATKEQIQSAPAVPTGGWAFAANQEWTRKVYRFYGDPSKSDLSELSRPGSTEPADSREFVRDILPPEPAIGPQNLLPEPAIGPVNKPPAADPVNKLLLPIMVSDGQLLAKVNEIIAQYASPATGGSVQAAVQEGVVTLAGKVPAATQKLDLETRIKALNGVVSLFDDQLVASNE